MNKNQYDALTLSSLQSAMEKLEQEPIKLHVYEKTDSTNLRAKELARNGCDGDAVIAADSQSEGRGRLGRRFYSPAGSGAYFSLLYHIDRPLYDAVSITCAASVAVMRAIRALTGIQTQIKWVNDIYLNQKKVCGILTEAMPDLENPSRSYLIVGIGINWHPGVFPEELRDIAGTLCVTDVCRAELIAQIRQEMAPFLSRPEEHSWLEDYRSHSMVIGRPITWIENGVSCEGTALAIDEAGALLVRNAKGDDAVLRTGEISVRIMDSH